jgi:hypothetical protein
MIKDMVVAVCMGLFLLIGFVYLLRLVQAAILHRTLRRAIDRDSPLAQSLVERIASNDLSGPRFGGNDDRTGMVLVAFGIALAGFSLVAGDSQWLRYGLGGALFPILVGAALLLRHRLVRTAGRDLAPGA